MHYKRYWLRGGFIFILIQIILTSLDMIISNIIFHQINVPVAWTGFQMLIEAILKLPFGYAVPFIFSSDSSVVEITIVGICFIFLDGMLWGWVYGLSRRDVPVQHEQI